VIARILGEGQWELSDDEIGELNELDSRLEDALGSGHEEGFRAALATLLAAVRGSGSRLPDEELVDSDLILPPADASIDEVRDMLGDEGLIPG
jgi:PspAA-like protein